MKTTMLLLILAVLVGVQPMVGEFETLQLKGNYVLPQYPQGAYRAIVHGSYLFRVEVAGGEVREVKLLSREMEAGGKKYTGSNSVSDSFVQTAQAALREWKFYQKHEDSFEIRAVFRVVGSDTRHDYTTYRNCGAVLQAPLGTGTSHLYTSAASEDRRSTMRSSRGIILSAGEQYSIQPSDLSDSSHA